MTTEKKKRRPKRNYKELPDNAFDKKEKSFTDLKNIRKDSEMIRVQDRKEVNENLEKMRAGMVEISQFESEEEICRFLGISANGWHADCGENMIEELRGRKVRYRPIYAVVLIYHLGFGKSFESFHAVVGVAKSTIAKWGKEYESLRIAREIGEGRHRLGWEHILVESAKGNNKGNAASIIFGLKNYYPDDFKDKREVDHKGEMYIIDTGISRPSDGQVAHEEGDYIDAEYSDVPMEQMGYLDYDSATDVSSNTEESPFDRFSEDYDGDEDEETPKLKKASLF